MMVNQLIFLTMIELKVSSSQIRELNSIYSMLESDDQEQKNLGLSMLKTLEKTNPIWNVKRISKSSNKAISLGLYIELANYLRENNEYSRWWSPISLFIKDFTHFSPRFVSSIYFREIE